MLINMSEWETVFVHHYVRILQSARVVYFVISTKAIRYLHSCIMMSCMIQWYRRSLVWHLWQICPVHLLAELHLMNCELFYSYQHTPRPLICRISEWTWMVHNETICFAIVYGNVQIDISCNVVHLVITPWCQLHHVDIQTTCWINIYGRFY